MVERNTKKLRRSVKIAERNICYLRSITWDLIRSVEKAAELYSTGNSAQLAEVDKNHNYFFGKASLVNTFISLADCAVRLDQQAIKGLDGETEEMSAHHFSDFDIALVENLLKDLRPNAVAPVYHSAEMTSLNHTQKTQKKNTEGYEGKV